MDAESDATLPRGDSLIKIPKKLINVYSSPRIYSEKLFEKQASATEISDPLNRPTENHLISPSYNPEWYKEAVFYEVYVRAFCDSNGDGHGDLAGLTSKLDYLHDLGVDCIWLLPMYPSPLCDDGYDVADYYGIHPDYGTLSDFKTLVEAVHERGMRIIADVVPNHTSDQCMWFQEARKSKDNPYRDWYVWSDTPEKYGDARIIFVDVEESNWTYDEVAGQYYWHRFFASQPDLNFENPDVQKEMLNVLKFWLDLGIDGFRVDAVPYLFEEEGTNCENLPDTHAYLKLMREFVDRNYSGRMLLAEACQMPHETLEYFGDGDEFHMGFHFPVMPRIYMAIKRGESECLQKILAETPPIPDSCQWVTFLRNHDELTLEMVTDEERDWMWNEYAPEPRMRINRGIRRRLFPLMDGDRRRIELAHSLLLSLPGSPIIYYGDEIGMGDNIWLEDRNGVRTPMQWHPALPHGGFSSAETTYAPVISDGEYSYERVNVHSARKDPSSFFYVLKHMLAIRRHHPALGRGSLTWVEFPEQPALACYWRKHEIDHVAVLNNVGRDTITVSFPLPDAMAPWITEVEDILTGVRYSVHHREDAKVADVVLGPYSFAWINVDVIV